jgi:hypothetical protein
MASDMRFRLVRPMRRNDTLNRYFVQRIPADVKVRAVGMTLHVPIGGENVPVKVTTRTVSPLSPAYQRSGRSQAASDGRGASKSDYGTAAASLWRGVAPFVHGGTMNFCRETRAWSSSSSTSSSSSWMIRGLPALWSSVR